MKIKIAIVILMAGIIITIQPSFSYAQRGMIEDTPQNISGTEVEGEHGEKT